MNITNFNTLALLSILTITNFAQKPDDSLRTLVVNPVLVTATNIAASRSDVPSSVTVITKEDIRQSGETSLLPIINKQTPGLFITERGVLGYGVSNGAAGTISIRGMGGSPNTEILVLTDGRPQMMGLMGHPLPDTYVSSDVERVEIIRGPASILHGTNAMGGVINIISPQNMSQGLHMDLGGSYGSFNTSKFETSIGYGNKFSGLSISGSHYETDGQRDYSSFRISNVGFKSYYHLSDAYKVSADFSISRFKTYDPGTVTAPLINNWVDITRGSSGISLENNNGALRGALKVFGNFGKHDIYNGFHSTDQNYGALFYQGYSYSATGTITAGFDYKQYGGKAQDSYADYGTHIIDEYGAYFLLRQSMLETLTLTAGLRENHHSMYGFITIPQAGLTWQPRNDFLLRASVGKGFRSPTIRELYLFPAPTPNLKPEEVWNYETGFFWAFNRNTSLDIAAYIANGNNQIRMKGFPPNATLNNSGSFSHNGIETTLKSDPGYGLELTANYSYLHPDDQTMANPKHKLYIGASYPYSMLHFSAGVQGISGLYGDDNYKSPIADYIILNARVSAEISPIINFYLSGENLTDRNYQIMAGYPMPGITLIAGIHLKTLSL